MLSRVRLASSKQICSIRRNGSLNARFYNYAAFKRFIRLKDSSAEEERMMVEINEAFYDAQKKLMKEKKKTALRNIRINYPFVSISPPIGTYEIVKRIQPGALAIATQKGIWRLDNQGRVWRGKERMAATFKSPFLVFPDGIYFIDPALGDSRVTDAQEILKPLPPRLHLEQQHISKILELNHAVAIFVELDEAFRTPSGKRATDLQAMEDQFSDVLESYEVLLSKAAVSASKLVLEPSGPVRLFNDSTCTTFYEVNQEDYVKTCIMGPHLSTNVYEKHVAHVLELAVIYGKRFVEAKKCFESVVKQVVISPKGSFRWAKAEDATAAEHGYRFEYQSPFEREEEQVRAKLRDKAESSVAELQTSIAHLVLSANSELWINEAYEAATGEFDKGFESIKDFGVGIEEDRKVLAIIQGMCSAALPVFSVIRSELDRMSDEVASVEASLAKVAKMIDDAGEQSSIPNIKAIKGEGQA